LVSCTSILISVLFPAPLGPNTAILLPRHTYDRRSGGDSNGDMLEVVVIVMVMTKELNNNGDNNG